MKHSSSRRSESLGRRCRRRVGLPPKSPAALQERFFDAEAMSVLTRFCTLAAQLPANKEATGVVCERCGEFLNAATNGINIVLGSFRADIEYSGFGGVAFGDRLVHLHQPKDRKVKLTCGKCGHLTTWWYNAGT